MLSVYETRDEERLACHLHWFQLKISRHETSHSSDCLLLNHVMDLIQLFNKTGNGTSALTIKAWGS